MFVCLSKGKSTALSAILTVVVSLGLSVNSQAATGFIDTADQCMTISNVVGSDLYLKRVGGCTGKAGRVFVEASPGETRRVFVDGDYWRDQVVKPMEISDVSGLLAKAESQGREITIPENKYAAEMQVMADKTNEYYSSPAYQERLRQETERIKGEVLGDQVSAYYKDSPADAKPGKLAADERVYVFVSSSMPLQVLRTYAADIAKLKDRNVVIVLRGFVGDMGKMGPTTNLIASVLKKNPGCALEDGGQCEMLPLEMIIDPLLYRRYAVNQVPTFVYVNGVSALDKAKSEGFSTNITTGAVYSVSGDASLKYVLRRIYDETGAKSLAALSE